MTFQHSTRTRKIYVPVAVTPCVRMGLCHLSSYCSQSTAGLEKPAEEC